MNKPYNIEDLKLAEKIQILHPQFEMVQERLFRFHELAQQGASARNLLLVGPSGTGKTSAILTFSSQHRPIQTEEATLLPVLYVRVPAAPTIRGLAEAILIALGAEAQMRGSTQEKTNQVVQLLKTCKTEMLVLDEFHHFIDSGRKTFEEVTEWLKTLIDTISVPTVLSGLPECESILRSNEQLRRRFAARVTLAPIEFEQNQDKLQFRDIVHAFDVQINQGRDYLWGLADWGLVKRLHFSSNGLLGYVAKVIFGGLEILISTGKTELTNKVLEEAFIRYVWDGGKGELNPFHSKFIFRRLDQSGEPFEPTRFTGKKRQSNRAA